jgi:hypothetical protein
MRELPVEEFFMIGKTLGHYEITAKLGKGGTGQIGGTSVIFLYPPG